MTCTKFDEIIGEFEGLLAPDPWQLALWCWGQYDAHLLISLCIWFAMSNAGDFIRRFGDIRCFPFQLMWLVESEPDTVCTHRAAVAARLIEYDHENEFNAKRTSEMFRHDLEDIKSTGKCTPNVYKFFDSVRRVWVADTQHNEGANNIVQSIIKTAPNIGMPLAGTRFTAKQQLCEKAASLHKANLELPTDELSDKHCQR